MLGATYNAQKNASIIYLSLVVTKLGTLVISMDGSLLLLLLCNCVCVGCCLVSHQ